MSEQGISFLPPASSMPFLAMWGRRIQRLTGKGHRPIALIVSKAFAPKAMGVIFDVQMVNDHSKAPHPPIRTPQTTLDLWIEKLSAVLAAGDTPLAILTASDRDYPSLNCYAQELARVGLTEADIEGAVCEALDDLALRLLQAPPRTH